MLQTPMSPAPASAPDAAPASAAGATATLRRAVVGVGDGHATPQDQIDCADLLLATGFPDAARMLYELAFLRTGFGPRARAAQRAAARRTGLWDDGMWGAPDDGDAAGPAAGSMIDAALVELARLVVLPLDPAASRLPPASTVAADAGAPPEPVPPGARVPDLDGAAFGALSTRLLHALAMPDMDALAPLLDTVRSDIVDAAAYRPAAHFNADLTDLAAMVAFNGWRHFFRGVATIGWAPFGSAALLAAASHLPEGGMGPYLGNVPRLIRSSRDLFGMLDIVGLNVRGAQEEAVERWCVLLSVHLDAHDRVMLVDDLGDLGLMRALRGLFDDAIRNPGRDRYLYWAIRDAALDNGETALAVAAQTAIFHISGRDAGELGVLAEILAGADGADAGAAAEDALARAVALAPHDRGLAIRLDALREGRFDAYRVRRGLSSSALRSAIRMRNRAARAAEDAGRPPA